MAIRRDEVARKVLKAFYLEATSDDNVVGRAGNLGHFQCFKSVNTVIKRTLIDSTNEMC